MLKCFQVFGIDRIQIQDFFELIKCHQTRTNHDYKLYVKVANRNCEKHSFFVRVVNK